MQSSIPWNHSNFNFTLPDHLKLTQDQWCNKLVVDLHYTADVSIYMVNISNASWKRAGIDNIRFQTWLNSEKCSSFRYVHSALFRFLLLVQRRELRADSKLHVPGIETKPPAHAIPDIHHWMPLTYLLTRLKAASASEYWCTLHCLHSTLSGISPPISPVSLRPV